MKIDPFSKNNVEISASIMCIDWLHAGRQLKILEKHDIDYLHWDVIDGRFAPDFTMGSSIINNFRENSNLRSDYHLMVEAIYCVEEHQCIEWCMKELMVKNQRDFRLTILTEIY